MEIIWYAIYRYKIINSNINGQLLVHIMHNTYMHTIKVKIEKKYLVVK